MRGRIIGLALGGMMISGTVQAEQYWTQAPVNGVGAVAVDAQYPQYSHSLYVGFDDNSWLPEKCRNAPGLLFKNTEAALLKLALVALEHGRPVTLKADDTDMIGDYCRLFQITVYAPPTEKGKGN